MASIAAVRSVGEVQVCIGTEQVNQTSPVLNSLGSGKAGGQRILQAPAAAGRDEARLSSAGTLIAKALSTSDVRAEKVAALRQSLDAGTYNVPTSLLSGKLLDSLLVR